MADRQDERGATENTWRIETGQCLPLAPRTPSAQPFHPLSRQPLANTDRHAFANSAAQGKIYSLGSDIAPRLHKPAHGHPDPTMTACVDG
ncbi:MAG: hypothetical protein M3Y74_00530 [Chloroflexota bacterium]|nr:hypothetical protein [Chloroflexota bacterium]